MQLSTLLENFPISPQIARARRIAGSRRARIGINAVFVTGALAAAVLTGMHFVHSGWPLANADPLLVVAAGLLFLFAYAFKAWGWQRLFSADERPEALTLAAAGGAASVGGVALPGRFDEAIRIAVVRRGPGKRTAGLGAICLTLIIVGLLDSAALTPMASVAAAASHSGGVQAGFALVAAAGVAAAVLVLFLPRIARLGFVRRWKVGRWLNGPYRLPALCLAGLVSDLRLVGAARRGRVRPLQRAGDRRLVPARARIPVRLGGVGRPADRTGRGRDPGRRRSRDPHHRRDPEG